MHILHVFGNGSLKTLITFVNSLRIQYKHQHCQSTSVNVLVFYPEISLKSPEGLLSKHQFCLLANIQTWKIASPVHKMLSKRLGLSSFHPNMISENFMQWSQSMEKS